MEGKPKPCTQDIFNMCPKPMVAERKPPIATLNNEVEDDLSFTICKMAFCCIGLLKGKPVSQKSGHGSMAKLDKLTSCNQVECLEVLADHPHAPTTHTRFKDAPLNMKKNVKD
jgi:hypothetical protein